MALVSGSVSCVAVTPAACEGFAPKPLPEFVFGSAATDISIDAMATAARIGYRWIRVPIRWNQLQPTVASPPSLTAAELASDPTMVERFEASADWRVTDAALERAGQLGLKVIGFVGASSPPTLNGVELDPASIGAETYVAEQALVTQAIVRRYGRQHVGAPAGVPAIEVWQTENELNIAPAATLIGWRKPAGFAGFLNSPWSSFAFQTELLRSLRGAVLEADPDAVTEINMNTDMNDNFNLGFGRPGWQDAVREWRTLADVIGLDTYPNYYLARPADGSVVGARIAQLHALVCPGQQTMVVETNYPNGPVARGYSPEAQAQFLHDAWTSSRNAGVAGFMPFAISGGGGSGGPDYTPTDHANLDVFGAALRDGDLGALGGLFLGQNAWMTTRLAPLTGAVEGYWGAYGSDGTALPALGEVRAIAAETAGH